MEKLFKQDVKDGLFALGLRRGMAVMVHSSLAGFGNVEGGADTVIDALLEVLGSDGTLMMPSFSGPDKVFDYKKSPCGLGEIPDSFWRRKEVRRSLHPTHSAAACGRHAGYFLEAHERAKTAYGENTPYKRLIDKGGFALMLGVDLDRLTILHTVEAFADAPYLKTIRKKYIDANGSEKEAVIEKMAGPHRNFIGLDADFRKNGIMKSGKIGRAVCRLIDAARMFDYCMERMKDEPDLMLCDNFSCGDCNSQRGRIRERLLSAEDFTLSASISDFPGELGAVCGLLRDEGVRSAEIPGRENARLREISKILGNEGIKASAVCLGLVDAAGAGRGMFPEDALEKAGILGAARIVLSVPSYSGDERKALLDVFSGAADSAGRMNMTLLIENGCGEASGLGAAMDIIRNVEHENLRLAYNPACFAFGGGKPFLDFVRKLKYADVVYINDGIRNSPGEFVFPGKGNAEIKEIISSLRARSFKGAFTLKSPGFERGSFKAHAEAFRKLLCEM